MIKQAYNLKIIFFNRCIILMETFKYYENKYQTPDYFYNNSYKKLNNMKEGEIMCRCKPMEEKYYHMCMPLFMCM